jgi:RecB family endonuclease NucS
MAIEAALMEILSNEKDSIFGSWDYISHQVVASPFKPIDYMDKMDMFGFRYIKGFETISKYLTIEIKKDAAKKDVIDQVMKYVDWINEEYAYGDYGMI